MTIAFVNSAAAHVNADTGTAHAALVITKPAGVASGHFLLAIIGSDAQETGGSPATTVTPPAGWTSLGKSDQPATSRYLEAFWKQAGGSEPASYSFGVSSSVSVTVSYAGVISAYSGYDSSVGSGMDGQAGPTTTGSGLNPPAPSITTTIPNDMMVCGIFVRATAVGPISAAPSGMTLRNNEAFGPGTSPFFCNVALADGLIGSTGATGSKAFTSSVSVTTGLGFSVAIRAFPPAFVPGQLTLLGVG